MINPVFDDPLKVCGMTSADLGREAADRVEDAGNPQPAPQYTATDSEQASFRRAFQATLRIAIREACTEVLKPGGTADRILVDALVKRAVDDERERCAKIAATVMGVANRRGDEAAVAAAREIFDWIVRGE